MVGIHVIHLASCQPVNNACRLPRRSAAAEFSPGLTRKPSLRMTGEFGFGNRLSSLESVTQLCAEDVYIGVVGTDKHVSGVDLGIVYRYVTDEQVRVTDVKRELV